MATRASKIRIIRLWGKGNINSLELQYIDKYEWKGTGFTQVLQECSFSRRVSQCYKSTNIVASDRCGMAVISRPPAPGKTHPHSLHSTGVLPTPGIIMSVRIWHTAHWFASATLLTKIRHDDACALNLYSRCRIDACPTFPKMSVVNSVNKRLELRLCNTFFNLKINWLSIKPLSEY